MSIKRYKDSRFLISCSERGSSEIGSSSSNPGSMAIDIAFLIKYTYDEINPQKLNKPKKPKKLKNQLVGIHSYLH